MPCLECSSSCRDFGIRSSLRAYTMIEPMEIPVTLSKTKVIGLIITYFRLPLLALACQNLYDLAQNKVPLIEPNAVSIPVVICPTKPVS